MESLCCDSTTSDTGRIKVSCIRTKTRKAALYLPCRDHIYELILKSVFKSSINTSSGPKRGFFKHFQQALLNIDTSKRILGIDDQIIGNSICKDIENILILPT